MKVNRESSEYRLIDKMLADESWHAASICLKQEALSALRLRRFERRLDQMAAGFAGLAVFGLIVRLALPFFAAPKPASASNDMKPALPVEMQSDPPSKINYINDEQLLAFFKDRPCVLAEINGKKELVFFDEDSSVIK
jgi:hypothetical protein